MSYSYASDPHKYYTGRFNKPRVDKDWIPKVFSMDR